MNKGELNVSEFTPENIGERLFSIPLYQRLYSWETEQVEQLLTDLYDTFKFNREQIYFIGNIVKSKVEKNTYRNALVDGQQRMTTLWLIGFVLKSIKSDWNEFICKNSEHLRLDFIAREEDRVFLKKLVNLNVNEFENQKAERGVNMMMVNAIDTIKRFFDKISDKDQKASFGDYIYRNAKLVEVTLPDSTDLNKYFEIMNNRGIQLEKHEILKARIISEISDTENKKKYAVIWDACAQMNQYLERSFEKIDVKIIKSEINKLLEKKFENINEFISVLTTNENINEKSFDEILAEAETEKINEKINEKEKEVSENFTSIVNFPTFLLHSYKVFTENVEVRLKDKDLLTIIEISDNDKAIKFIEEVLILRILFDQYIIKNYRNGTNNLWETRILTIDKEEIERKKDYEKSTQILAMLNVSTSTEHWFTPVLAYLRQTTEVKDEDYMEWLENLDNSLAYARLNYNDLMPTSNLILKDISNNKPLGKISVDSKKLSLGTATERYWFYKLDYCLWKKWIEKDNSNFNDWKTEIKGFQFRSNRSIEHIFPQNPEDENTKWKEEDLNSFGNLALISISSNSEYNRNVFKWKQFQFKDKIDKKKGIESLKLVDIYSREIWNEEISKEHETAMLKILSNYHFDAT